MQSTQDPRIVIISCNPIMKGTGNGSLMRSLFTGWHNDRIAQVILPFVTVGLPEPETCRNWRVIEPWGGVVSPPGDGGAGLLSVAEPRLRCRIPGVGQTGTLASKLVTPLREAWYVHSWIGRILRRELARLRPDVVYALLGNYWMTRLACDACAKLRLPLYIHVTDDFVTSMYQGLPFASMLQSRSEIWFRRAAVQAVGLAGIGPIMAREYSDRYGGEWSWFTTLLDAHVYDPAIEDRGGPLRLVFAGGLHLDRWRTLRALALALKELYDECGLESRLAIYGPPEDMERYRDVLNVPPVADLCGWARPEALPAIFKDADVLVHVESFSPAIADYTKLSLSTKLSQYMMSGRCVLGIGPRGNGSMSVIRMARAGGVTCEEEPVRLKGFVRRLLENPSLRRDYGESGRRFAMKWFEGGGGRERFRNSVRRALDRCPAGSGLNRAP